MAESVCVARVASYIAYHGYSQQSQVSFLKLSEAGFWYQDDTSHVICEGCLKELTIENIELDPSHPHYHSEDCRFRQAGHSSSLHSNSLSPPQAPCDNISPTGIDDSVSSHSGNDIESDSAVEQPFGENSASVLELQPVSSVSATSTVATQSRSRTNSNSSSSSSYLSDVPIRKFADEGIFSTEAIQVTDRLVKRGDCPKNPGHFAYFSLGKFRMEYLPPRIRKTEVYDFFKLCGDLTVKVLVTTTSEHRYGEKGIPVPRAGTGFALKHEDAVELLGDNAFKPSSLGKLNKVQKYLPFLKKGKRHLIFIATNRHIVFDDIEASHTTVDFFYDFADRKNMVTVKGVAVFHSPNPGDQRSILMCKTSDQSLVATLETKHQQMWNHAAGFPQKLRAALSKRVFVISHPHGGEKVLSYGESVIVRYGITAKQVDGKVDATITKIDSHQCLTQDPATLRKVMLYTADTCQGSSGAPVFAFQQVGVGADDHPKIELKVWMHNGVEICSTLNASTMNECTAEDLKPISRNNAVDDSDPGLMDSDSEDEDSQRKRHKECPVFTVKTHPSHPAYIAYQKRLESFKDWTAHHIHMPEDLAYAGFFYAGYADCVRCFQCGVGLRSWKPGDNVYTEHEKHRPNCQFLELQLKSQNRFLLGADTGEQAANSVVPTDDDTGREKIKMIVQPTRPGDFAVQENNTSVVEPPSRDDSEKSMAVKLLKKENEFLNHRFLCKVCFKQPCKDLFLPCGELYACLDCSKLLTHCPSCGKEIKATVTTYFA